MTTIAITTIISMLVLIIILLHDRHKILNGESWYMKKYKNIILNDTEILSEKTKIDESFFLTDEYHELVKIKEYDTIIIVSFEYKDELHTAQFNRTEITKRYII